VEAGGDHVAIQVLGDDVLSAYRGLAGILASEPRGRRGPATTGQSRVHPADASRAGSR
jgi:hypothetical protein